jgi:uncharacterized membrane protein
MTVESAADMIHHWKPSGSRSGDWMGVVLAGLTLAMAAFVIAKGGWLAAVPFGLAAIVIAALLIYLGWLDRSAS